MSPQTLSGILDALGHHRLRLRAVGAAAADHVAADARRPEPRGVLQEPSGRSNSDYERHRVLKSVVSRSPDAATARGRARPGREHQQRLRSRDVPARGPQAERRRGPVRAPFFKVVGRMSSGYEKGRLLQAVVKKPGVSDDTLREVLQSSRGMSGYELSQLLMTVAAARPLDRRSPRRVPRRRRSPLRLRPEPGARGAGEERAPEVVRVRSAFAGTRGQVCVCRRYRCQV